jgi:hypothetical protein
VRELDTARVIGGRGGELEFQLLGDGKLKAEAIADAGLSKTAAYRYQDLAGPRDKQAQHAGKAAAGSWSAEGLAGGEGASPPYSSSTISASIALPLLSVSGV